ncbi:unnamed protein product [Gadus morhua 'NCC']
MPGDELLNSGEQTSEDEAVFPLGTSSSPLQTSAVQTNQGSWSGSPLTSQSLMAPMRLCWILHRAPQGPACHDS